MNNEIKMPSDGDEIPLDVVSAVMLAARLNRRESLTVADDYHANLALEEIAEIQEAREIIDEWTAANLDKLNQAETVLETKLEMYLHGDPTHTVRRLPAGELSIKKSPDSVKITVYSLQPYAQSPLWMQYISTRVNYIADKRALMKILAAGETCPFAVIEPGQDIFHYRLTDVPEVSNEEA